jgi:mono/diheme cytochrome c family protein
LSRSKRRARGWATVAAAMLVLPGCTDAAGYDLDILLGKLPWIATLREHVAYRSHQMPRTPAPGTVPVLHPGGDVPPPFTQLQLDSAAATLTNPLPRDARTLELGRVVYANQCAVCHGPTGLGDGPIIGQGRFPFAPPVTNLQIRSDGYLYAVTRAGRGLMPEYGSRTTEIERWAVVHYIRALEQMAGGAAPGGAVPPPGAPLTTDTAPPAGEVPDAP